MRAGGTVAVVEQGLQRFRMSWEEFLDLRVEGKAEWVDGEVVVSPPANVGHGEITVQLAVAIKSACPNLRVGTDIGVWLPRNRLRGPDLMGLPADAPRGTGFLDDVPLFVIEILSPSTRSEDLLRKGPEYAAAGIAQYWVVDPHGRSIEVFDNVDGTWEPVLRLDDEHPAGEVSIAHHGAVPLNLQGILGE
jgi:Uma2 family endonuclease